MRRSLSLTRGRVSLLQLLLAFASESFLGPSPVGLATIFYCLKTSLFVASYDSQGHGGGIRPLVPFCNYHFARTERRHRSQQSLYCCLRIRCRGNLLTELLPNNGRLLLFHFSDHHESCCSMLKIESNNFLMMI
jgi:hypothetical protein